MLIKKQGRSNAFFTQLQFKSELNFKNDRFYSFSFRYLINYDICNNTDVELHVFLADYMSFSQILFDSKMDLANTSSPPSNREWNSFSNCFQIFERNYVLYIIANSTCDKPENEVFVAVDEILISETSESDFCKNFIVTSEEILTSTFPSSTSTPTLSPTSKYKFNIKYE